jgi:excisionase family DNA binding protein
VQQLGCGRWSGNMDHMTTTPLNEDQDELAARRLLDVDQAAEVLNVPASWLQVKAAARAIPHTRIGKHLRFSLKHLDQIIASGEVAAEEVVKPRPRTARRTRL